MYGFHQVTIYVSKNARNAHFTELAMLCYITKLKRI